MNRQTPILSPFLWGAATSAHQIEGGNRNDWTKWEKTHDLNINLACDHYHRFRKDFDLVKALNLNAHRFSIEWSRIEPTEGSFDEKEINHYRQVIRALKDRGIRPCITLWHYTLPIWVAEKGGWLNSETPSYFIRFVDRVVREFNNDISIWFTMNEPEIFALHAFILGDRPPGQRNILHYFIVMQRIIRTHKQAYKRIKEINPNAAVGVAKDVYAFTLSKPILLNQLGERLAHWFGNHRFFHAINNYQDFLGLNYYVNFKIDVSKPGHQKIEDMGWEHTAEGLPWLLQRLKRFGKPFIITENGIIDADDRHRKKYIANMLQAVHKAKENGFDIRGYFHWTLIDCVEWNRGFDLRFGLIHVDPKTLRRNIRASAYTYAKLMDSKRNGTISENDSS